MKSCLLVGLWMISSVALGQEVVLERWDRAICLNTERKTDDGLSTSSSAFIVEYSDDFYLVTAKHSAQGTNALTRVVYRTKSGESRWVNLGAVVDAEKNPWWNYENADLSVASLKEQSEFTIYYRELGELAIKFECLTKETPSRTAQIEIVGFPMSLGAQPPVSAFATVAHVASKDQSSPAQWGTETVFFAAPCVANGTSGGPVFAADTDRVQTSVVGMYVGLMADNSGAKLSKIIPSQVIRKAIERSGEGRAKSVD